MLATSAPEKKNHLKPYPFGSNFPTPPRQRSNSPPREGLTRQVPYSSGTRVVPVREIYYNLSTRTLHTEQKKRTRVLMPTQKQIAITLQLTIGSFSHDNGNGKKNPLKNLHLRNCDYFAIIPSCSHCTMLAKNPTTGLV